MNPVIAVSGVPEEKKWPLIQAILESFEKGASRHAISLNEVTRPNGEKRILSARHARLGLVITFIN